MNPKDTIKRNFSRCAAYYDSHCRIQQRAGLELISALTGRDFDNILDIGCGTGNYTKLLRDRFSSAKIKAVDISPRMIDIARRKLPDKSVEFVVGDAERLPFNEKFDLITSNASVQWFDDLGRTLAKYKNALKESGIILFSMFGPQTFQELRDSASQLYKKDMAISSAAFMDRNSLSAILEKNFNQASIKDNIFRETYGSLWDLLTTIKYTGTQGTRINGTGFTRSRISELEKIYKEKFDDITATYQIFYCYAKRAN